MCYGGNRDFASVVMNWENVTRSSTTRKLKEEVLAARSSVPRLGTDKTMVHPSPSH